MTTGRINQVSTRDTLSRNTHLWSPHKHASHYHNTQTTCAAPCSHQLNALTHFHHYWLLTHMAVYTSPTYVQQPCRDFQTPFYIPFTTTQRIHKYADTNHTLSRAIHDFTIVCVHCKVASRIRVVPCALTHQPHKHAQTGRCHCVLTVLTDFPSGNQYELAPFNFACTRTLTARLTHANVVLS